MSIVSFHSDTHFVTSGMKSNEPGHHVCRNRAGKKAVREVGRVEGIIQIKLMWPPQVLQFGVADDDGVVWYDAMRCGTERCGAAVKNIHPPPCPP